MDRRENISRIGSKKSLQIKGGYTCQSIIQSTPNIEIFDAEDIECSINTWLTPKDKVIGTNVMYHIVCLKSTHYV